MRFRIFPIYLLSLMYILERTHFISSGFRMDDKYNHVHGESVVT